MPEQVPRFRHSNSEGTMIHFQIWIACDLEGDLGVVVFLLSLSLVGEIISLGSAVSVLGD